MSYIQHHIENHVLHIQMNRPQKKNALSFQMYGQMADLILSVTETPEVRAVLLKGDGRDFTAGNDLADFAGAPGHEQLGETVRFMNALMECHLPVVAQVQGLAVGIGTTMLLHCDLVYCAEDSRFCLPFINLALVPEYASSYLLPRLVGHRKAAEWLMLGEPFDATEALHFGIVNKVLPVATLQQEVDSVLGKLVSKPHQAMAFTKSLLKANQDEVAVHINDELDLFIEQLGTPAAREAFAAFIEKRRPDPKIYN
ncbi:enoyl-CoA hydratase [Aliiglaciecola sp. CAU 1673]|uniref:enoyl-CoA hydratase n=1 Tax=Aliiglaciecola sp. CAU 1673 TaxID=3032595 RepID=UPI0023DC033C|nr:enoyl-CoA hydratase [Aliiglaciecola sp. CAU 1673]MDF2180002.1 enoyl-CoA hydratase [Aliiglaciecola sp. CAU 1673]